MGTETKHVYQFGTFRIDPEERQLLRGQEPIPLPPKAFEMLLVLVQHSEHVVLKDDLMRTLWPDTFVEEANLSQHIFLLRKALGEKAHESHYIVTVPGKGYRLAQKVQEVSEHGDDLPLPAEQPPRQKSAGAQPPPAQSRKAALRLAVAVAASLALGLLVWRALAMLSPHRSAALGAASIHSIAVLPFTNLSGDPNQEYFADGMTDALITDLAQIGSLRVISRSSAMRYKGVRKPLSEIAKELNVDAVVEGSVARSGNRVRIDAQLIQAPTDRHLWARSYERDLSDVLVLQGDLARAIAAEIQAKMTSQEQQRLANARSINPAAQEDYLKGLYYWGRRPLGLQKGIEFFQQALEKEPTYALPYAGLALSYATMGSWENGILPPREAMPKAKAAGQRALELDDTLSQAHAALAYVQLHYDWDWAAAEKEFQRAIELNRNDPIAHHWYSHYLTAAGRNEESLAESKRAQELDPLDPVISIHLAWLYYYGHHYDKVIEQSQMVLEANPQSFWPHFDLGWAYEQKGMFERAIAEFQKTRTLSPASTFATAGLGHAYGMAGNRAEAVQILRELIEQSKKGYVPAFDVAVVYEGIGDDEHAFEWLEKAYAERSSWLVYLKQDPRFDSLHSNPHFQDLLRRVGVPRE